MKYNRGSVEDTLRVATKITQRAGVTRYVFATACGMTIDKQPPPFGQQHYRVSPQGAEFVAAR